MWLFVAGQRADARPDLDVGAVLRALRQAVQVVVTEQASWFDGDVEAGLAEPMTPFVQRPASESGFSSDG